MVACTRGSSAGKNPTIGSIRFEASSSSEPNDWVKAEAVSLQPSRSTVSWISSWTRFQSPTRPPAPSRSASAIARSSATQHMTLE